MLEILAIMKGVRKRFSCLEGTERIKPDFNVLLKSEASLTDINTGIENNRLCWSRAML